MSGDKFKLDDAMMANMIYKHMYRQIQFMQIDTMHTENG